MARDHRRVLTLEEARNLPPLTEAELAARRAAMAALHEAAVRREREGRGIPLADVISALDESRDGDWPDERQLPGSRLRLLPGDAVQA